MRVSRWGNGLAIRLPASVVQALELKEGEEVEIHVAGARQFEISRKPNREELLKRLRAFRGRLPANFKFDRDEAEDRQMALGIERPESRQQRSRGTERNGDRLIAACPPAPPPAAPHTTAITGVSAGGGRSRASRCACVVVILQKDDGDLPRLVRRDGRYQTGRTAGAGKSGARDDTTLRSTP